MSFMMQRLDLERYGYGFGNRLSQISLIGLLPRLEPQSQGPRLPRLRSSNPTSQLQAPEFLSRNQNKTQFLCSEMLFPLADEPH